MDSGFLSDDARAILKMARKRQDVFTRTEAAEVAPGAAWDPTSRWPKTIAKLDPICELIRDGLVEVAEERPTKRSRGRVYKIYKLVETELLTLEQLLDRVAEGDAEARATILRRYAR